MKIEIWSDVMCPFCYIGKRHFEKAVELSGLKDSITVEWKSFQLNPDLVTQPERNSVEHLAESKGWSLKQAQDAVQYVTDMAAKAGLEYHLDRAVVANSMDAHRLSHLAKKYNAQDAVEEGLFVTYFTKGLNTADHGVLTQIGTAAGIPEEEILQLWNSDQYRNEVQEDIATAAQFGITGVPFFVINRKYGVSGAQPVAAFIETLQKVSAEEGAAV
jgi:predicted DsbA family dithiol-disulfide isomerase